jgi:hypothetical protein
MILHSIGDSHCEWPWKNMRINDLIIFYHVRPSTCASIKFRKEELNIIFSNIQEGQAVCWTLGEIDCRHHIGKFKENYKEIIDNIIYNYFDAIKYQERKYKNLQILVSCIVPPRRENQLVDTGVTLFGKETTRKTFVLYFNEKIREYCAKNDFYCLDCYNHYIDSDGYLNSVIADKFMHILDPTYLMIELKNIFKL